MASNVVQATMPGCQNSIAYIIKEIHFMILSCIIIDIYIYNYSFISDQLSCDEIIINIS